jgi:hypothetical protein
LNEAGRMSRWAGYRHVLSDQSRWNACVEDILATFGLWMIHHPITRLVCLENTHNICCGGASDACVHQASG